MNEQTDDPDDAVIRLESALERIAQLAGRPQPPDGDHAGPPLEPLPPDQGEPYSESGVPTDEIASRLDDLIDRLRLALAAKSG